MLSSRYHPRRSDSPARRHHPPHRSRHPIHPPANTHPAHRPHPEPHPAHPHPHHRHRVELAHHHRVHPHHRWEHRHPLVHHRHWVRLLRDERHRRSHFLHMHIVDHPCVIACLLALTPRLRRLHFNLAYPLGQVQYLSVSPLPAYRPKPGFYPPVDPN